MCGRALVCVKMKDIRNRKSSGCLINAAASLTRAMYRVSHVILAKIKKKLVYIRRMTSTEPG